MATKKVVREMRRIGVRTAAKRKSSNKKPSSAPLSRKALNTLVQLSAAAAEFFEGNDEAAPFDVRKERAAPLPTVTAASSTPISPAKRESASGTRQSFSIQVKTLFSRRILILVRILHRGISCT